MKKNKTYDHKLKFDVNWQMNRFSLTKEQAEEKIKSFKQRCATGRIYSVEWQMSRYKISEEQAKEKIQCIKNKQHQTFSKMSEFDFKSMCSKNPEHWIKKGYCIDEAKKIATDQVLHMQKCFRKQYKENPEKYKDLFNTSIKYWLKKANGDLDLAKELFKERQATNTLQKYIKKYGDDGYEKFKQRNINWSALIEQKYKNNEFAKHSLSDCKWICSKAAQSIWDKHFIKMNLSKEKGFINLIVWEKDFITNQNQTIQDTIEFIKNNL